MAQDRLRKSGPFRHLPASRCNLPGGSVLAAIVAHFLTAINTLACGATWETAAQRAGVSKATVQRRMKDPAFRQRLQDLGADMVKRASAGLTAASGEAIKTLVSLMPPTIPHAVRLGAAKTTLETGIRLREVADTEERLAALEAQMASQPSR